MVNSCCNHASVVLIFTESDDESPNTSSGLHVENAVEKSQVTKETTSKLDPAHYLGVIDKDGKPVFIVVGSLAAHMDVAVYARKNKDNRNKKPRIRFHVAPSPGRIGGPTCSYEEVHFQPEHQRDDAGVTKDALRAALSDTDFIGHTGRKYLVRNSIQFTNT